MLAARMEFFPAKSSEKGRVALVGAVQLYLLELRFNGQTWGKDEFIYWKDGVYTVELKLPKPNSVEQKWCNAKVKKYYQEVVEASAKKPRFTVIGDRPYGRVGSAKNSKSLIVTAHMHDNTSPVKSGATGAPIPLYLLPLDTRLRDELVGWQSRFWLMDDAWYVSGSLELEGYKEMADPFSCTANCGRELASRVEKSTGLATYYFLFRFYSRPSGEESRRCPVCNGKWAIGHKGLGDKTLSSLPLRCDRCRLVSKCGSCVDGRRAHIGEYRDRSQ